MLILAQESDNLQLGKKLIPRGATHIEVTPRDLLTQEQLKVR